MLAAFASATVGLFVWATDRTYGDTVFYLPTSTLVSTSSPYVLPTAYVRPSSYLFPSYVETSYTVAPAVSLLPTGYIETTYRRGLFGRRWIVERPVVASYPTAYIPTTYVSGYVPTTYVSSYVPTTYVPTTYVSSYVPTTYVAPTYYSTSYRVNRYRPTTYTYYPTIYETAYTKLRRISAATRSWWIRPSARCLNQVGPSLLFRGLPEKSSLAHWTPIPSTRM